MKQAWNWIKYWGQLLLLPIYLLSCLMPRDKKRWVFGSTFGRRFADNPKYFYLFMCQNHASSIRSVWISKNQSIVKLLNENGYECYHLYSLKGIWNCLRAKVYLYDNYSKDICFTLSGGALRVNMWHGIPLKKIQKDNLHDKVRNPDSQLEKLRWSVRRLSDEKPSDYVIATSNYLEPLFRSAFQTDRILRCGYPRNDSLISDRICNLLTDKEVSAIAFLEDKCKNKKMILYMPTFRESEKMFFDVIELSSFQDFLTKNDFYFCVKLHPKSKLESRFKEITSEEIGIIDAQADAYPLLKLADILVTDYSSIYFDFLLLKKPMIFFPYDYVEYKTNARDFYFDYEEFTPGPKAYSQTELEEALHNAWYQIETAEAIAEKVFNETAKDASGSLYSMLQSLLL